MILTFYLGNCLTLFSSKGTLIAGLFFDESVLIGSTGGKRKIVDIY